MTTLVKATVELPSASGFADDTVVNTFVIGTPVGFDIATESLELTAPLADFYTASHAGSGALGEVISDSVSRVASACLIKLYDLEGHLDGTPLGSPVGFGSFTMPGPLVSTQYPNEVAVTMTLRGQSWDDQAIEGPVATLPTPQSAQRYGAPATFSGNTRPRQRYTGRLYLGPFSTGAGVTETGGHVRPATALRDRAFDAAEKLVDDLAVNGHGWLIWSRRRQAVAVVERVEMDDAWDTQRRRGARPTVRWNRTLVP